MRRRLGLELPGLVGSHLSIRLAAELIGPAHVEHPQRLEVLVQLLPVLGGDSTVAGVWRRPAREHQMRLVLGRVRSQ